METRTSTHPHTCTNFWAVIKSTYSEQITLPLDERKQLYKFNKTTHSRNIQAQLLHTPMHAHVGVHITLARGIIGKVFRKASYVNN